MTTEQKALAWAAEHMLANNYADACYYVRTGSAIWFRDGEHTGCTCEPVPKSYAPYLTAQAIDARRAATGTGAVHESAVPKGCAQPSAAKVVNND